MWVLRKIVALTLVCCTSFFFMNSGSRNASVASAFAKVSIDKNYDYYKNLAPSTYEEELKEWFKIRLGKDLNLDNPQTFNEKIQWLKLYDSTPLKTRLTDKYLVREWVKKRIGEKYLVPLIGIYNNFDEIDFNMLPNKFVLKANHGSSWNMVIKNKDGLNRKEAKRLCDIWVNTNFAFRSGLELHYKNINPKIIIEKYIDGNLNDYRILCFNGKPTSIWVDTDVTNSKLHNRNVYKINWELEPYGVTYPKPEIQSEKPQFLNEMLNLAEKLSEGFCFVRVDFFESNGVIYFSEMTFTPHSGVAKFTPERYDKILGDMIKLPDEKYDYNNLFNIN